MNDNDLMRMSEFYDEKISFADFTPEDIEEMVKLFESDREKFKEKYFDYYDDIKHYSRKKQDW